MGIRLLHVTTITDLFLAAYGCERTIASLEKRVILASLIRKKILES